MVCCYFLLASRDNVIYIRVIIINVMKEENTNFMQLCHFDCSNTLNAQLDITKNTLAYMFPKYTLTSERSFSSK